MSSTQQLLLGEGAGGSIPVYIEEVFSTWLYTGTDATLAIPNGIDLSTKGGLVWIKNRTTNATFGGSHQLVDTVRGLTATSGSSMLSTNNADSSSGTNGYSASTQGFSSFDATGFTVKSSGGEVYSGACNTSGVSYTSWTFREQEKFFDVVTYTGNGAAGRTVAHNLKSVPGCIIVKTATGGNGWNVWHKDLGDSNELLLNSTAASTSFGYFGGAPTSTTFTVDGAIGNGTNTSGQTFIAYVFAHNAGGFGLAGTDNVISCGSFTTDGSGNATVSLGYEPQWLMIKQSSGVQNWNIFDSMRGMPVGSAERRLFPNSSAAEDGSDDLDINATGFTIKNNAFGSSVTCIYIACRRPMKVPTVGTSVFTPIYQTPQSAGTLRTVGFPADLMIGTYTAAATPRYVNTRLIGLANNSGASQNTPKLATDSTAAQADAYPLFYDVWNTTARDGDYIFGSNGINWLFGRAPSVFDVVCYTGTGSNRTITHNLAAVPELMIVKQRGGVSGWPVYAAGMGNTKAMRLNSTQAEEVESTFWNNTTPTSTVFSLGNNGDVNQNTGTYVWYGFATCAGVSKVGSYTGTGAAQTINCGFTAGSRFIMIKRTDSTGDWYVWDSARGIIAGDDPYLLLNTTGAQVTNTDYVDTYSAGFEISSTAPAAINASAGTFIFLAIA